MAIKQAMGVYSKLCICPEKEFKVPPDSLEGKVYSMPFNSVGVAATQNTTDPATMTGRRDAVEPIMGNIDVRGDIVFPMDSRAFGYWLAAAFAAPTTTKIADGKYQHVFKIQNNQPSFTLEKAFPGIGQYIREYGCKLSKMSFSVGGDGELVATISVMGTKEEIKQVPISSSLIEPSFDRTQNFQARIKIGGEEAGKILTVSLDIDFGLDGDTFTIGSNGFREGLCEGLMTISGQMEAFFKEPVYLQMAADSVETSMEIIFTANENFSMSILMPEIKFSRTSPGVDGPGGVKSQITYNAYYNDAEQNSAIVFTLLNKHQSYDPDEQESATVTLPTGEVYGKTVADLSENLVIGDDGVVTGTLKHVTGYTGFSSTESEQSGYYLPFSMIFPEGTTSATMQVVGGSGKKVSILGEASNVVRLGATPEEAKARYVSIEYTDEEMTRVLKLDTSAVTYKE